MHEEQDRKFFLVIEKELNWQVFFFYYHDKGNEKRIRIGEKKKIQVME